MIYELRSYRVSPGRLNEVLDNATRHTIPLFEKLGIEYVGFWTVTQADAGDVFDFVYLLRWQSRTDRETKWQRFMTEPNWLTARARSDANGPLVVAATSQFLEPTPFSRLQ